MYKQNDIPILAKILILIGILISNVQITYAAKFSPEATYQLCFTPGQNCTKKITTILREAKHSIFVQAYSFTSRPIEKALLDAKERGVEVKIILDKSQASNEASFSSAKFFQTHGVPVWIDSQPAIAHNKVMVIDNNTVITGSFNFTHAANTKNAENVLIIQDLTLAEQYLENWKRRQRASVKYEVYQPSGRDKDIIRQLRKVINSLF